MAHALQDAKCPTLRTGLNPLKTWPFVYISPNEFEMIDVERRQWPTGLFRVRPTVFRICDCRLDDLLDGTGSKVRHELERGQCLRYVLTAYGIDHKPGFSGRNPHVSRCRSCLVLCEPRQRWLLSHGCLHGAAEQGISLPTHG